MIGLSGECRDRNVKAVPSKDNSWCSLLRITPVSITINASESLIRCQAFVPDYKSPTSLLYFDRFCASMRFMQRPVIRSLLIVSCVGAAMTLASCGGVIREVTTSPSTPPIAPPTTSASNNTNVLSPATTPSAVGVCLEQMQFGADGSASPLLCSNGAVNSAAWNYFQSMYPNLFALGEYATQSQVADAVSGMTSPIPDEEDAYCLAKAYYGWQFGISLDPANQVNPENNCASDIPNFP